jgi:uncharacterized membrane protein YccC
VAAADLDDPEQGRTATLLHGLTDKLFHALRSNERIVQAADPATPAMTLPDEPVLAPFMSNRRVRLSSLRPHLGASSPVLRFALRLALAMLTGFVLGRSLPYAAHGHWIMLTTAVVMRPSFSHTRQRHNDRIFGNLLGCVLAAALLHLIGTPVGLLPFLFVAIAVAHAFVTVQYRVTSTAACIVSLLQLHLLRPDAGFAATERIVDTVIGAAIGLAFSFLLPIWERHSLPELSARLRLAASSYVRAALDPDSPRLSYRLERKGFLDAVAALSQATARMLDEPRSRRQALPPLHGAVSTAYLLAAQLASVRVLLAFRMAEFDPGRRDALLALARMEILRTLGADDAAPAAMPEPVAVDADIGPDRELDAHVLLRRRLEAAREDALRLAGFTQAG